MDAIKKPRLGHTRLLDFMEEVKQEEFGEAVVACPICPYVGTQRYDTSMAWDPLNQLPHDQDQARVELGRLLGTHLGLEHGDRVQFKRKSRRYFKYEVELPE
jgi:hypothetical protein